LRHHAVISRIPSTNQGAATKLHGDTSPTSQGGGGTGPAHGPDAAHLAWQVPGAAGHDRDFGSSPVLFGGSGVPADVGACNALTLGFGGGLRVRERV